jgi:hypothetical protein
MQIIILFTGLYLSAGFGFAFASYLQAAEISVNNKKGIPPLFTGAYLFFVLAWWLVAIYCYRTEVSRTIQKTNTDINNSDNPSSDSK